MKFTKPNQNSGPWLDIEKVVAGTRAKLVSEAVESEGKYGLKVEAKIRVEGENETKNVNINKPSLAALINAYGDDSKNWINKVLTLQPKEMFVSGREVIALFLIPEGYHLTKDQNKYLVIVPMQESINVDEGESEVIDPSEIPF